MIHNNERMCLFFAFMRIPIQPIHQTHEMYHFQCCETRCVGRRSRQYDTQISLRHFIFPHWNSFMLLITPTQGCDPRALRGHLCVLRVRCGSDSTILYASAISSQKKRRRCRSGAAASASVR